MSHGQPITHHRSKFEAMRLAPQFTPVSPTADVYRIAGYTDGLIASARPECNVLRPKFDSGIRFADKNHPRPDDVLFGGGVGGGVKWDGTFYRDLSRYAASGALFWCAYLKPGTTPGYKNGYWLNFGAGWAHLANDDFAQLLTGAATRIYYDSVASQWKLVIEATLYVTGAVVDVWTGMKPVGNDPVGPYAKQTGCDPATLLTVEAV